MKIIEITRDDIVWPFDDQQRPYILIGAERSQRRTYVDPYPAYGHDISLVRELIDQLEDCWPAPFPTQCFLLPCECPSRSNGWKQTDWTVWAKDGQPDECTVSIAIAAKRIPIHPAMTRYVVAHEYGHVVEDAILMQRGEKPEASTVLAEYRNIRGLPPASNYGAGTWHLNACEVFANDFRVLVAKVETEFWPHPGIPRPEDVPAIWAWWHEAAERTASSHD